MRTIWVIKGTARKVPINQQTFIKKPIHNRFGALTRGSVDLNFGKLVKHVDIERITAATLCKRQPVYVIYNTTEIVLIPNQKIKNLEYDEFGALKGGLVDLNRDGRQVTLEFERITANALRHRQRRMERHKRRNNQNVIVNGVKRQRTDSSQDRVYNQNNFFNAQHCNSAHMAIKYILNEESNKSVAMAIEHILN